ncbi:MAG: LytTR family DNA-binding domain-containing protein [Amphiplicatus sp.]
MKALIVEDEAPAARRLERLAREIMGDALGDIVHAETVEEARAELDGIDLIMLDLDLDGADGFEVIRGRARPLVVVVSARADRAIDAFEHAVVDFVTKPVSRERLETALNRARERFCGEKTEEESVSLVVRSAGRIDLAPAASIVSLSGADDYVEVALIDGRKLLHDMRLDALEKKLPASFVRVHRSHIANMAHVRAFRASERVLEMADGSEISVSRRRAGAAALALKKRESG